MRLTRPVAAVMCSLALASCATGPLQIYEGPSLPDTDTALISAPRLPDDRTAANVRILSVENARGEVIRVTSRSVRILPRETCIEARATTSTLDSMSADLCFEPYSGGRYEVRASVSESTSSAPTQVDVGDVLQALPNVQSGPFNVSRLFVMDMATRRIVASSSP